MATDFAPTFQKKYQAKVMFIIHHFNLDKPNNTMSLKIIIYSFICNNIIISNSYIFPNIICCLKLKINLKTTNYIWLLKCLKLT